MKPDPQTTKWADPVPLNTLTRSDGRYVWVWSCRVGWQMFSIEDAHSNVSNELSPAIPIPTPFALLKVLHD